MNTRRTIIKLALPLVAVLVALVLSAPRALKWGYDYRKGTPWKYETLVAQFDFPILKTQAQIDEERSGISNTVVPYYRFSSEVASMHLKAAEGLAMDGADSLKKLLVINIRDIYERGVVSDDGLNHDHSSEDAVIYIQKDKRANLTPVSDVLLLSNARAALLYGMLEVYPDVNVDSVFRTHGVYELIVPNLQYDQVTTNLVHSQTEIQVSPTLGYVNAGQIIVSEDELVTPEIAQILDSYKAEYENVVGYRQGILPDWGANVLISICLLAILMFFIYFANREIFNLYNKYLYIMFIYMFATVFYLLVGQADETFLFLIPLPLFALYLLSFFRNRTILPVYVSLLLPLLVFSPSGVLFFMMYLAGGIAALYSFKSFNKGALQFLAAFIIFLTEALVLLAFNVLGLVNFSLLHMLARIFVGSMLIVAFYPLIYLFERIFGLMSVSRLIELSDISRPVLRLLENRAPGTFQHTLQVVNIAGAAARGTGADELLVRAGALYHDIGKILNPQCFVENESLVASANHSKYHQELSALQSAQDIIRHVTDGVELARESRLPQEIIDFIETHHGTTTVTYFLNKYLNEGGDETMVDSFRYHGRKPETREQVIVMLSDSIEAASRTLTEYSKQSIQNLVHNIIKTKMDQGQLDESNFTVKDIKTVTEVFTEYLFQIYHERVVYPKRKRK